MAVMATRGRRRIPVVEAPSPGLSPGRLPLVALATVATGAVATAVLYLSSSERGGFLTWILGAVRRACH